MNQIKIKKETTVQAYGEFWESFTYLKIMHEKKEKGWHNLKLSSLTMACFSIEGSRGTLFIY